jgi:hypothetical protein
MLQQQQHMQRKRMFTGGSADVAMGCENVSMVCLRSKYKNIFLINY